MDKKRIILNDVKANLITIFMYIRNSIYVIKKRERKICVYIYIYIYIIIIIYYYYYSIRLYFIYCLYLFYLREFQPVASTPNSRF